jgi:hypothetical protein
VNPGADKAKSISPVGDLIHHVQHGLPVAKEWDPLVEKKSIDAGREPCKGSGPE